MKLELVVQLVKVAGLLAAGAELGHGRIDGTRLRTEAGLDIRRVPGNRTAAVTIEAVPRATLQRAGADRAAASAGERRVAQRSSSRRRADPASALAARLRDAMGVPDGMGVLLGNGSDELIQMIAMSLSGPSRAVLSVDPGFVMFRLIATFCGMRYVGVPLAAADFAPERRQRVEQLRGILVPDGVEITVTRNYGETANEKAQTLIQKLVFATAGVVLLVMLLNGDMLTARKEIVADLRSEVTRMEREVRAGEELLVTLQNSMLETEDEIVRTEGLSRQVIAQIEQTEVELATLQGKSQASKEHINALQSDLLNLDEKVSRIGADRQTEMAKGAQVRAFLGQGDRQYLTGLRLGGKRPDRQAQRKNRDQERFACLRHLRTPWGSRAAPMSSSQAQAVLSRSGIRG